LIIEKPTQELLSPLSILLDPGEAEAVALAMSLPESTVLLDDAQARRVAERFGVNRIGTLGILRRAKKQGWLMSLNPISCSCKKAAFIFDKAWLMLCYTMLESNTAFS
jgi:hypothetical protein